jgi:hypothetical protein
MSRRRRYHRNSQKALGKGVGYTALAVVGIVVTCCVCCLSYSLSTSALRQIGVLPTLTPRPTGTPRPPDTPTPLPPTATSTSTPAPTTDVSDCSLGATFELDVTVPDNTKIALGESFAKTWRLRNTGNCKWGNGYHLVFVDGERMACPERVAIPETAPGDTVDISVRLIAPMIPGSYRGNWRACVNETECFGDMIYVQIIAFDPFAPTQTPVPTATTRPVITYRCGAVCNDGWRSNATGRGACSHHGGVAYWVYCER